MADLTLELQSGYNVITGETGAGKSIIIGALSLVLGERADRTLIRSGSESCSVEAVFDAKSLGGRPGNLAGRKWPRTVRESQLVVKRTFTSAGANRQFINGSPTTLGVLAALGESLVDIHGPHDHQSLLHTSRQLAILDAFGNLQARRAAFGEIIQRRSQLAAEKAALIIDEKTYAQQLDLLRFQTGEIRPPGCSRMKKAQLQQEHQRSSNAHKLGELSRTALDLLGESETALLLQAGLLGRTLQEIRRLDAGAAD